VRVTVDPLVSRRLEGYRVGRFALDRSYIDGTFLLCDVALQMYDTESLKGKAD
jgi:hypothetical protein